MLFYVRHATSMLFYLWPYYSRMKISKRAQKPIAKYRGENQQQTTNLMKLRLQTDFFSSVLNIGKKNTYYIYIYMQSYIYDH